MLFRMAVGLDLNVKLFLCLPYLYPDYSFLEGWVQYTTAVLVA